MNEAPSVTLDPALDIVAEINRLRQSRKAVILAHYYQVGEIQDIADFVGDSLDLSRKAANTEAEVIVFCGVRFMGEVAKILSPGKTVLVPDMSANCSLEDSCQPEPFKAFVNRYPDHMVLSYINCSAEVKALSDIIVTSSNAESIIRQIPQHQQIVFAPDRHLGRYLSQKLDREMVIWPGACIVHEQFSEKELVKLKTRHPDALVAAHPECPATILRHADHVGSTSSIIAYALQSSSDTIIIATEAGILHQLQKAAPGKTFIVAPGSDGNCNCNACPYMGLNTMEKLYLCLRDMRDEITLDDTVRKAAEQPLVRMLKMS